MRADRLLSIVLLLQKHQQLTAKTLSERLGVTERTIYRDINALSLAGVPVYTQTGPDGGCFLDENYRMSLSWFTGEELQTLLYTGSASVLSDLGMQSIADDAILKLLSMLPNQFQKQAHHMQQRLYLDPSSWYQDSENYKMLPILKDAVWNDLVITSDYESWDGSRRKIRLYPYSLVYKSGRWYLVALDTANNEMRTYRANRLLNPMTTTEAFKRDEQFDVAVYWQKASEQFQQKVPTYPVSLRAKPSVLPYFRQLMSGRYTVTEQGEDWWVLNVTYAVFEEARTSVLGLGTEVEVISPTELHQGVVKIAKSIVDKWS